MLSLWCVCVVIAYFGTGRDVADGQERVAARTRQGAHVNNTSEYTPLLFLSVSFVFFIFVFHFFHVMFTLLLLW